MILVVVILPNPDTDDKSLFTKYFNYIMLL